MQGLDHGKLVVIVVIVVIVETVEHQPVVQEGRCLPEDLAHHRGVDVRPRRRGFLTGRQQQVEGRMHRSHGHGHTMGPLPSRRNRFPRPSSRPVRKCRSELPARPLAGIGTGLGGRMNGMGDGSLMELLGVLACDGTGTTASDGFGGDIHARLDQVED